MTDSKFCEHGVNVGLENPPVFCGQCPPDTITKLRADLASVRLDYANECDRARRAEARHERDKDELRADLARVTKERDEARANACRCADDESCRRVREGREAVARAERAEKERDAELASLRAEAARLAASTTRLAASTKYTRIVAIVREWGGGGHGLPSRLRNNGDYTTAALVEALRGVIGGSDA